MEFYNCVIFIQERDPQLSTHREFNDTNIHFYAIGNIGDSKKTDNTRLTDQGDPYECCIEIMDVELPLSDFPKDTMYNAMGTRKLENSEEVEYIWAKPQNLDKLYELDGEFVPTLDTEIDRTKAYYVYNTAKNSYVCAAYPKKSDLPNLYELNGTYKLTEDTEIDFDKTYYIDILANDDFSENFTYGWRYISNKKDSSIVTECKNAWIDFYRFVTTTTDEEFKANLGNYFVVDSALYYYLFTTRYCMVDNRAKNSFWHYGKTANGTSKWDLCWDYDNDTALGLDNYGKQAYRYGLEDIDVDDAGAEVFRESDSKFFCRIRDCFGAELEAMYNRLESAGAWHAESFLEDCDAWQKEFPEELWRVDIERKYIRTYSSSGINGNGDHMFLDDMSHGRQKYHRRQWERSQEKYMASKYKTATSSNDRVTIRCADSKGDSSVDLSYDLSITPYAYMYINTTYSDVTGAQVTQKRVTQPGVPVHVGYPGGGRDIGVHSASLIQDLGDLSRCYPHTLLVGAATRLRSLDIGNDTPGYKNAGFETLTTDANPLLEELDIENVTGLTKALNLSEFVNLTTLRAKGTGVPSVLFAEGSKIADVELPAVNSITLTKLKYLTSEKFKLEDYNNVVSLKISDCPNFGNQLDILEKCANVNIVELDSVDFGEKTYSYFEENIFKLVDSKNNNAALKGSVYFAELSGAQYNEIHRRYPDLVITYGELNSEITFDYTLVDNTEVSFTLNSLNGADVDVTELAAKLAELGSPAWQEDAGFTYEQIGWSTVQQKNLGPDGNHESDYERYMQPSALFNIVGDKHLYPVFKATRKSYTVTFINPTAQKDGPHYSVAVSNVPYGNRAACPWTTIKKLDVNNSDLYIFNGWLLASGMAYERTVGHTECFAQFAYLKEAVLTLYDITPPGLLNEWSSAIDTGYRTNSVDNTMEVIAYKQLATGPNSIIIPDRLNIDGTDYTITTLGGFYNNKKLAHINIADTVTAISKSAFKNCENLTEVDMPDSLTSMYEECFAHCKSLASIAIPGNVTTISDKAFTGCKKLINFDTTYNPYFEVKNNCLFDSVNKRVVFGQFLDGVTVPSDSMVIGEYCFSSNTYLKGNIELPESLTNVRFRAFGECIEITSVNFAGAGTELAGSIFSGCTKLAAVSLPAELKEVPTYAFNQCALSRVELPATVKDIKDHAFGYNSKELTVEFNSACDLDRLDINSLAFIGTVAHFKVPWSRAKHEAKFGYVETAWGWGAKNATFEFDFVSENT
jgi:hypothetical protein